MSDSLEDFSLVGPAVLGNVSGVSNSSKEGILDATLLCSLSAKLASVPWQTEQLSNDILSKSKSMKQLICDSESLWLRYSR